MVALVILDEPPTPFSVKELPVTGEEAVRQHDRDGQDRLTPLRGEGPSGRWTGRGSSRNWRRSA